VERTKRAAEVRDAPPPKAANVSKRQVVPAEPKDVTRRVKREESVLRTPNRGIKLRNKKALGQFVQGISDLYKCWLGLAQVEISSRFLFG
jgi:hypothetical protein